MNLIVCRPRSATATRWIWDAAEFRRLLLRHLQTNSEAIEIVTRIGRSADGLDGRVRRCLGRPGHVAPLRPGDGLSQPGSLVPMELPEPGPQCCPSRQRGPLPLLSAFDIVEVMQFEQMSTKISSSNNNTEYVCGPAHRSLPGLGARLVSPTANWLAPPLDRTRKDLSVRDKHLPTSFDDQYQASPTVAPTCQADDPGAIARFKYISSITKVTPAPPRLQ
jgi:hypothetical protein